MNTVTIGKPWRYLLDGHLADVITRRTFRGAGVKNSQGVKNLPCKTSGLKGWLGDVSPSGKYPARISIRPHATMNRATVQREPESANDANIEQAQDSLAAALGLLPAQPETFVQGPSQKENMSLDMGGFSNLMLIAHPLAIVYITSCQPDNRMLYVSPQIANLGFTPAAWLGKPDLRLQQVYEEDSAQVEQAFKHSCATAETFSCHYRLYDSAGKVHWFHDEASVVCDESGAPLFIRGVMLDITDKKAMEAELALHRYYLEWNVEKKTEQLVKRVTVLESCNQVLCDKLTLANKTLASLNQLPERAFAMECADASAL